jgi:hypothetical protein
VQSDYISEWTAPSARYPDFSRNPGDSVATIINWSAGHTPCGGLRLIARVSLPMPNTLHRRRGRGPARFKKTDVVRAAKAALAAGLSVERVVIDPATGKISVLVGKPGEPESAEELQKLL